MSRFAITIGDKTFSSKTSALKFYKEILNKHNFGEKLSDEDSKHLIALGFKEEGPPEEVAKLAETIVANFKELEDFNAQFDFDTEESKLKLKNHYCLPKTFNHIKLHAVKYDNVEKFVDEISEYILDKKTIHCLISGDFIFGDFFEAFAVKNNLKINDLTISTSSISQDNVDSLANLFNGDYLDMLNIIVSDYFWRNNRQNAPYIYENLDIDNKFQLAVANIRTKISLMKIGDMKFVIKGSANFRSSRSIEEFTIECSDELYDFHKEWHDFILDEYSTIRKEISPTKLYDSITKNCKKERTWEIKPVTTSGQIKQGYENDEEPFDKLLGVMVDRHPDFRTTKCFYFLSVIDGEKSKDIFSYRMAINGLPSDMQTFSRACRFSVHERIRKFKMQQFKNRPVRCAISNEIIEWEECQVDHKSPLTFSVIVKSFLVANNLDISKVEYTYNNSREKFVDETITEKFYEFHRKMAVLRIISTKENLKLSGSARVKPTQKDGVLTD
jgi:hypothetical protein